jgi:hypothetical protein
MTVSQDIIRMAREAGIKNDCDGVWCTADQLERFASLVAAAEREACAKKCEQIGQHGIITQCVHAIRARGKE